MYVRSIDSASISTMFVLDVGVCAATKIIVKHRYSMMKKKPIDTVKTTPTSNTNMVEIEAESILLTYIMHDRSLF
jgi:hypothetical protein